MVVGRTALGCCCGHFVGRRRQRCRLGWTAGLAVEELLTLSEGLTLLDVAGNLREGVLLLLCGLDGGDAGKEA